MKSKDRALLIAVTALLTLQGLRAFLEPLSFLSLLCLGLAHALLKLRVKEPSFRPRRLRQRIWPSQGLRLIWIVHFHTQKLIVIFFIIALSTALKAKLKPSRLILSACNCASVISLLFKVVELFLLRQSYHIFEEHLLVAIQLFDLFFIEQVEDMDSFFELLFGYSR